MDKLGLVLSDHFGSRRIGGNALTVQISMSSLPIIMKSDGIGRRETVRLQQERTSQVCPIDEVKEKDYPLRKAIVFWL